MKAYSEEERKAILHEVSNSFSLVPERTALVVVDVQYAVYKWEKLKKQLEITDLPSYFIDRLQKIVVPNAKKLLDFFRENGLRIIFLTIGTKTNDFSDLSKRRRRSINLWKKKGLIIPYCQVGTEEHRILDELKPLEGEIVINKNTGSAFNGSNIDQILRNLGTEILVMTGVATDGCVENTLRDAADRSFDCILVDDACATGSQEVHDAALRRLSPNYCKVEKTAELIRELGEIIQSST